jgi:2-dehydropantoate 2-reductase
VWGAGPVGLFLGGVLAGTGLEVVFWGRPALLEPLRLGFELERHHRIEDIGAIRTVYSAQQALDQGDYDMVLVCYKALHNPTLMAPIRALAHFPFLVMQNGVGNEEFFAETVRTVYSGTLSSSVYWRTETCLRVGRGGLGLALMNANIRDAEADHPLHQLGDCWSRSGVPISYYPSYQSMKWSKLLLNVLGNPLAAALALPPDRYLRSRMGFQLERCLLGEMLSIVRVQNLPLVNLPGFPVRWLPSVLGLPALVWRKLLGQGRGGKLPSLLMDRHAGRPLDIETLLRVPLQIAEEHGIAVPTLSRLWQHLVEGQPLDFGQSSIG